MPKFRISKEKNLILITQSSLLKLPINEQEIQVFERNLIPGLFRPKKVSNHKLVYNAPLGVVLKDYLRDELTTQEVFSIVAQTVEVVKRVKSLGFPAYNIILDEQLVFVKQTTKELFFVYTPVNDTSSNVLNVFSFLTEVLKKMGSVKGETKMEIECLLDFLSSPERQDILEIEKYVMSVCPDVYKHISRSGTGRSEFIASSRLAYDRHNKDNRNNTISGETQSIQSCVCLMREKTKELIEICTDNYVIGKDSAADYCIKDNAMVSRKHATIKRINDNFYLVDNGSTNKTYVGGKMLVPSCNEILHDRDVIVLADEVFKVTIRMKEN